MSTNFYARTSGSSGKLRTRLAALAAGVLLAPAAWAQAPANDNCTGAIALTPGATCTVTTGTNVNATASGTPALSCGGTGTTGSNDVWYSIVVPAGGGVTVTTSAVTGSAFDDSVLELYSGTCGTLTSIGCNDDATGLFSRVTVTGRTAGSTIYARVSGYGDSDTPTGQFGICATIPSVGPTNDAAVQAVFALGKTLVAAPQVVQAIVRNQGGAALTNLPVTLNVTGATTFTDAKVVASLAPGATTTVTFAAYTPSAVGTNAVTVTVPADDQNTNNSRAYPQVVTANSISYLDDSQPVTASVGVSAMNPGGTLAVKYATTTATPLTDVKLSFLASPTTTSTYQVVVLNATPAGLPNAVVFTSPTLSRPATAGVVTVPITATTVNGTFFVGLKEVSGNVGIGYQVEDPLRPATFYFQITPTGAWADVNTTPLRTRIGIEVTLNRPLTTNSPALSKSISMYPNPSNGQVTLDIRDAKAKGAMQVQVTNMLGQIVHTSAVRDNAENKLNLSGLADGMYVVRVSSGSEYTIRQLVLTK